MIGKILFGAFLTVILGFTGFAFWQTYLEATEVFKCQKYKVVKVLACTQPAGGWVSFETQCRVETKNFRITLPWLIVDGDTIRKCTGNRGRIHWRRS